MKIQKIFNNQLKWQKGKEYVNGLLSLEGARVEIITSFSAPSKKDFWYDQSEHEFVMVISGKAVLNIEGETVKLKKGDYLTLPPNKKHRVEKTSLKCVWLCIFYKG